MANEYFGKVTKKGIQIIPVVITDFALGTLGSLIGVIVSSGMFSQTRGFLCKKIHILMAVGALASTEAIIIGINGNDGGVSGGYGVSNLPDLLNPEDTEDYLTDEELVKTNWHETSSIMMALGSGAGTVTIDKWISVGGGKGIPSPAGAGPEIHAFNPTGDSLTTGALLNGIVTFYGVWLED